MKGDPVTAPGGSVMMAPLNRARDASVGPRSGVTEDLLRRGAEWDTL